MLLVLSAATVVCWTHHLAIIDRGAGVLKLLLYLLFDARLLLPE